MTQFETDLEAKKAFQQAEAAKTSHNLAISESTSDSDTSRLEADKARQQTEAAKTSHDLVILQSTSDSNTSRLEMNKATKQTEASQDAASSNTFSDDVSDEDQKNCINKQKQAVKRMLKCESNKYYQILEVNDSFTKQKIKKAYKKLALLLHSDKNKYKDAEETFKSKQSFIESFETILKLSLLLYFIAELTSQHRCQHNNQSSQCWNWEI